MNAPVTVVIPTYKRPAYLSRLLTSVSRQSLLPAEVVVVDDASDMDAEYLECISSFAGRLPSISLHKLSVNGGAPAARNEGIRKAGNDWIALVDDDDEWLPEKLERQWSLARVAPKTVGLITSLARVTNLAFDAATDLYLGGKPEGLEITSAILQTNFIVSSTVLARKEALLSVGLFDESLHSCQDWDMWTRIFMGGYSCEEVPEVLAVFHKHGGPSIGGSNNAIVGHLQFFKKHWWAMVTITGPFGVLRLCKGILMLALRR